MVEVSIIGYLSEIIIHVQIASLLFFYNRKSEREGTERQLGRGKGENNPRIVRNVSRKPRTATDSNG